nr:immunoglobulin heavy chain junction region [Mus musculus]
CAREGWDGFAYW